LWLYVQIVRLLLDAGSKTDVCESRNHQSPLYVAVQQQYIEAVKMIIDAGKLYVLGTKIEP
jgi:ankyrin repeat protein